MRREALAALALASACATFDSASTPDSADAGTDGASTADAGDAGQVDESTCPGATFVDTFDQSGRVTVRGEWYSEYGSGGLSIEGGTLHAEFGPVSVGKNEHILYVKAASARSVCVTMTVKLDAPQDFSGWADGGSTLINYIHTQISDASENYTGLELGYSGVFVHHSPGPDPTVITPITNGIRFSMIADYGTGTVRIFFDGVEKMRFNDPGMDGGALASEFHLGLSSSATSPAVSLHYDDVRVRFDMP